jgi:hypothetical protein
MGCQRVRSARWVGEGAVAHLWLLEADVAFLQVVADLDVFCPSGEYVKYA